MAVEFAHDFDMIVDQAKALEKPIRVVIAGADVENILLGAFDAQEDGFVSPILVGNRMRIMEMLERLGLTDRSYDLQPVSDDVNVVQYSIEMILAGKADVLMRGNTQTRDFLMPVLNKSNHLLSHNLMTHVVMLKIPGCEKITAISDVTILVEPSIEQRKEVIRTMVRALRLIGVEDPNIAILSLVEKPSFHMKDTVEAQTLVMQQKEEPFAKCNLVGPIPYDLIVSKEAARLKGYDCPYCGEFDGIVAPNLLTGNLMIKILENNARANSFGIIMGAKIPIAITSRSDSKEQAYLSLAACALMKH
jgi:phosphotransacetylase